MHQISTFLTSLQNFGSVNCSAIIVALHANKQRGQGNFGDSKVSVTTRVVEAFMSAFVPEGTLLLVMEAMPLQQFPLTCGKHGAVGHHFAIHNGTLLLQTSLASYL